MSTAKAEYRQLGKSGLRVSVPILGAMSFGSELWSSWILPEEKAFPILKAAWDSGINTIDTANMYSNGVSEQIIGSFIRKNNIPRKNIVLLTKIQFFPVEDLSVNSSFVPSLAQTREYVNQGGLSRTAIFNQTNDCLARLDTDYIDLLQIHAFDATTPIEETMKALHDLVSAGKVRYLGACNSKAWQLGEMNSIAERHGWTQFISVQIEHSLLFRPQEVEMLAYCMYKGIGVISYSPLLCGHLARPVGSKTDRSKALEGSFFERKLNESDEEIVKRVEQIAKKRAWKMSQVALAWSCTKVTSPIVGLNSIERVAESIIAGKTLDAAEIQTLEEPYQYRPYRW
ncbi:Aldo/keto reductase [Peniophora sp. CONT]|nr:Aldo/keto reductase [Peniophora sp. CONT]